jgi:hypothetical protein
MNGEINTKNQNNTKIIIPIQCWDKREKIFLKNPTYKPHQTVNKNQQKIVTYNNYSPKSAIIFLTLSLAALSKLP